jgi:FkbM family methyltransferase
MAITHSPSLQIEGPVETPSGGRGRSKRPSLQSPSDRPVPIMVRALGALLERLPDRLRRAALREFALTLEGDYAAIQALGRCAAVSDISITGDLGLIQGSLDDTAVLATYCRTKTWRPAFARFFNDYFRGKERGLFIDVGANIGLTTIPVARNSGIACFAFEPDPANFRYLRNNVEVNCPRGNVQLFNLALFDSAGSLDFQLSGSNKGDHRLCRDRADGALGERQWPVIQVPTARLDDVLLPCLDDAGSIAAKIVVQGAEAQIVAGGRDVLSCAGAMLVEVYPYGIERLRGDFEALLRFCAVHFTWGALNEGEHDSVLTWMPVQDVADHLRERYRQSSAKASEYFHLFLRK